MSTGGVTLSKDEIRRVLSNADGRARTQGEGLKSRLPGWVNLIEELRVDVCPRTYVGVLAVLLAARALRPATELDVLDIQRQTGPRGYSASSIGVILIPFATEQGIDLRSKSTAILNNQPFTFKARLEPNMAKAQLKTHYDKFYAGANRVNELSSDEALDVLALLFALSRVDDSTIAHEVSLSGGLYGLRELIERVDSFVTSHSDNGKVGQAFVAAVLDTLYGRDAIILGNTADPDSSIPGDVQAQFASKTWLWCEVKQKPVVSGDVEAFLEKTIRVGGNRVWYCALANVRYPHNIDPVRVERKALTFNTELKVYTSPSELMSEVLTKSPGSFDDVASKLATAMMHRMAEANCPSITLTHFLKILPASNSH